MFSLKTFVKLFVILLSCISSSISNKLSKRYKIEEQNIDFGDFLLNSPNRGAQLAQLQMLADSKRRKAPVVLSPEQIRQELDQLNSSYQWQPTWPDNTKQLGAVSAVAFDVSGNVVVFHRADRIWNAETFDLSNVYTQRNKGRISQSTIVGFERSSGKVLYEWGKDLFYMPHGLTIDQENNAWITDVALHQVMKFSPQGGTDGKPILTLGTQFRPGNGKTSFCKPTSVAVLPDGDFFVADGYCNARIIKFSKSGERILSWGENSFFGVAIDHAPENHFAVPHALTLAGDGVLCVADRENGRIQCFHTSNGTFISQFHNQVVGDRLFSVAYSPVKGGQLFVVNGPIRGDDALGFVFDFQTGKVLSKFGRNGLTFSNPHDIVVTEDGSEIYIAELNPNRVHKLISSEIQKSNSTILSGVKPTVTLDRSESILSTSIELETTKREPGQTALIVTALIVIFALLTFGLALLIARRRKRGCMPFGVRNRRHAWEFPNVKSDGFKLGNLLDRTHGFEKLDQEASDDEPNVTTNMLSNSQFA